MTPPLAPTLPPWPDIRAYIPSHNLMSNAMFGPGPYHGMGGLQPMSGADAALAYQIAHAAAWEARAHRAVAVLEHIVSCSKPGEWPHDEAKEALAAIGPLPPLPDLPTAEKGE